jgi:hypothetical protein
LSDYAGTLNGNQALHFTFVDKPGGEIEGSYFLESDLQDHPFHGKVIDASSFSARVPDAAGPGTAAFLYLKADKSKTTGVWLAGALYGQNGNNQKSVSIALKSSSPTVMSESDRYAIAGAQDRAAVESTAHAFWLDVTTNRAAEAAEWVSYPLAYTENGRRTLLHNGIEFEKKFPLIFTPAYVAELKSVVPKAMPANDRGIMLGAGLVLFGPDGRAFALNNETIKMFAGKKFLSNAGWVRSASHPARDSGSKANGRAKHQSAP